MFERISEPEGNWEFMSLSGLIIKLCDFGLSRTIDPGNMTKNPGTTGYQAPEVQRNDYGTPADIYSLGMVALKLMLGHPPEIKRGVY